MTTTVTLQLLSRVIFFSGAMVMSNAASLAHSFNVALVIPLSGANATDGKQMRDGFMLATRERDSHPDEVADGHLGGLDVYVYPADSATADEGAIGNVLEEREIDIIAASRTGGQWDWIVRLAAAAQMVPLDVTQEGVPSDPASAMTFNAAFKTAYGYEPSPAAAQGYHAARRIDDAVRAQEGVADKAALAQSFRGSETGFTW